MKPKYTKIIATLGPATSDVDTLRALIRAGADCFRLNFSHAGPDKMAEVIERARKASHLESWPITLLADIQGPKIRIGDLPEAGVTLRQGQPFAITQANVPGSDSIVHSPYPYLAKDLMPGARVLFSDGMLELRVDEIEGDEVRCTVITGGLLRSRKGINLPGVELSIATLTAKDERDLAFCGSADVDIVAISFVRTPKDLLRARQLLGNARTPVMAKLERPEALDRLDEILDASDGVMVARGDLGVELPFQQVPVMQKRILARAAQRGKWAVVATQMLSSMVDSRRPTRAEASDVVNAVLDGTDAVMLSEETAVGRYPVEAVAALGALTREGEGYDLAAREPATGEVMSFAAGAAGAAVAAAEQMRAKAIVTLAGSGLTALLVSKWRPHVPIVALSSYRPSLQRLNVLRGTVPVPIEDRTSFERQLLAADRYLLQKGFAEVGDTLVVVAAVPLGMGKETNTIRFHRVRAADSRAPLSTYPDEG
ncbi:MAG: pyruvate kinase [Myxococcales bacterium]|nr:pyruvate kinase [Myxococcales bacterium]